MSRPRFVPDDPDPREFRPVRFACLDRPGACAACRVEACRYGRTPGERTPGERTYANFGDEVFCLHIGCGWAIKAPDHDAALAAYERHLAQWHGGAA